MLIHWYTLNAWPATWKYAKRLDWESKKLASKASKAFENVGEKIHGKKYRKLSENNKIYEKVVKIWRKMKKMEKSPKTKSEKIAESFKRSERNNNFSI